ncbi:hypothetical protein QZH41_016911, partial [Actinostola sp. cb2023]
MVTGHEPYCSSSPCTQPKVVGFCRGVFLRFYYNSTRGKCQLLFTVDVEAIAITFVPLRDVEWHACK